jgi:hypothetical protein
MATAQTVTIYSKATGVGGTALVMTATSVGDAAAGGNSIEVGYFVELVAGNAASRVPIAREDFLAIRQLRNLAVP